MDDNLASENAIYNFESKGSPQLATGTCVPWAIILARGRLFWPAGKNMCPTGDYFGPRAIILARGRKMTKPTQRLAINFGYTPINLYFSVDTSGEGQLQFK